MRILAVDTATRSLSVAVSDEGGVLSETLVHNRRTHSQTLMPAVDRVLAAAGLTAADIDAYAVVVGPGSFTGLRIGLAAVKGMAFAAGAPVVGVSSLAALAEGFYAAPLVCPLLDARKNEVYTACYRFNGDRMEETAPPRVLSPAAAAADIETPCILVGDGALHYRKTLLSILGEAARLPPEPLHHIRASVVDRIARRRLAIGDTDDTAALAPFYIRSSDAKLPSPAAPVAH